MKLSAGHVKLIWMLLGFVLFFVFYFTNPFVLEPAAGQVLAVALLMLTWWVTEALPMPVVALVPMVAFPMLGLMKIDEVASSYGDPVVFLFMGGFMIGLAMEKWNLHQRIALSIVKVTGTSANRIILGFIIATAFISMWLSNTATTMMMFPIGASVIALVEKNYSGKGSVKNFSLVLMLCLAYAANIGGIATPIGTPPNVVMTGILHKTYGYEIGFLNWMLLCLPLAILILFLMYWVLVKLVYPNRIGHETTSADLIRDELHKLGPLSKPEKYVLAVFLFTALLWIVRMYLNQFFAAMNWIVRLDDTIIALIATFLLFFIPLDLKSDKFILEWKDTSKMAWGILLLFGGGLCLAGALEKEGLIKLVGEKIAEVSGTNILLLVVLLTVLSIFLSELMSNVAMVTVFVPVVIGVAEALHVNPLLFALPVTLGASTAFMLPMGTPPNAIVFASGKIRIAQMAKAGFILNLICSVLITLFVYFIMQWFVPPVAN